MGNGGRRDMAHTVPSGDDGERGPTWADVRWMARDLEQTHACTVSFRFGPMHLSERWTNNGIWVRARAYAFRDDAGADIWQGAQMGGNAGSRTMPGACVHALVELSEACASRQPRLPETDV